MTKWGAENMTTTNSNMRSMQKKHQIAVFTSEHSLVEKARTLAHDLGLPIIFGRENSEITAKQYHFLLIVAPDYLGLLKTAEQTFNRRHRSPFYIDFLSKEMRTRSKKKGLRSEFLARAIGIHPRDRPHIVDATAGLGRDSFMLAALGFEVTMLEVSPILYVLLKDALTRAENDEIFSPIIERMHLVHADAMTWLKNLSSIQTANAPDVIYLDPMFPARKKSAAVKKGMAILQELLENCDDPAKNLLDLALTCAKGRVVVKRPRLATTLSEHLLDFSIKGKSSRFDVYIVKK
jgi:16S rRNA (guanine1516-N2)-methyltransferase